MNTGFLVVVFEWSKIHAALAKKFILIVIIWSVLLKVISVFLELSDLSLFFFFFFQKKDTSGYKAEQLTYLQAESLSKEMKQIMA